MITYTQTKNDANNSSALFGLTAIEANWGNMGIPVPVRNQTQLLEQFREYRTDSLYTVDGWLQAFDFLKYSDALYIFRYGKMESTPTFNIDGDLTSVSGSSHAHLFFGTNGNSVWNESNGADLFFKPNDFFSEKNIPDFIGFQQLFVASRYPGTFGNKIEISIITNSSDFSTIEIGDSLLSDIFDERPNDDEFAFVVSIEGVPKEFRIVSSNRDDANFIENINFKYVICYFNKQIPEQCIREPLYFGQCDALNWDERVAQIESLNLNPYRNLIVLFSSDTIEVAEAWDSIKGSRLFFYGSQDPFSNVGIKLLPAFYGKTILDPISNEYIETSYSGDVAGLVVSKLNQRSYSELIALPEREFQGILSVRSIPDAMVDTGLQARINYIARKGNKFTLQGNFSDIQTGMRKHLNIRILLAYVEKQIELLLNSFLFQTDYEGDLRSDLNDIKKSVRIFLKTFDITLKIDGKNIDVDIWIETNQPYRTLRFNVDYGVLQDSSIAPVISGPVILSPDDGIEIPITVPFAIAGTKSFYAVDIILINSTKGTSYTIQSDVGAGETSFLHFTNFTEPNFSIGDIVIVRIQKSDNETIKTDHIVIVGA